MGCRKPYVTIIMKKCHVHYVTRFTEWSDGKPSGYYIYHQFNIQQFCVLPTQLYLCVFCGSQNKQRLFPNTALTDGFV